MPCSSAISQTKDDKWRREERAFFKQLPTLMQTLKGKWVAVHLENVVEIGDSLQSVLARVRERFPKTEVYIQRVEENLPVAKMLSPRQSRLMRSSRFCVERQVASFYSIHALSAIIQRAKHFC